MKRNIFLYFFIVFIIISIIVHIALSITNKTLLMSNLLPNILILLLFIGLLFYYRFINNKTLLYISYFLLLISLCLSLINLIIFPIRLTSFVYVVITLYFNFKLNIYLYKNNDIFILTILSIIFTSKECKYKLAWIYNETGKYKKSINLLKNCKNLDSLYLLAVNNEQLNENERAIEIYTNILLLDKNERPDILYNRGRLFNIIGKNEEAIDDFTACIKCKIPDPKAYIALRAMEINFQ